MAVPGGLSGAPGTWWVVQEGLLGDITNRLSGSPKGLTVTWHAVQQAAKPNSSAQGPYATEADAQAEANTLNAHPGNVVAQGAKKAAQSTGLSGLLASVGDFLGRLESAAFWERVGEVLIGIVLIAAGVAKLTDAIPAATKIAGAFA